MNKQLAAAMLLATAVAAWPQTRLDLRTQTKNVDFSGALSTRPIKVGTAIPAVCTAGELYFKSDAPAGSNLFGCTATNTWTVMSAAGGSAAGPFYCVDTGSVNAYACSGVSQLTAYANGQLILLLAGQANTGAATLNINGLGAKAIRKSGAQALAAGEIAAGQVVSLAYDGTAFQVQALGIAGPQGPQGPQGPTGATGAAGPAGPAIGGLLTSKGDTVVHDGAAAVRLAACPDGQMRVADSTQTSGWRCSAPAAGGGGAGALFCVASGTNAYSCSAGTATQYDLGLNLSFQAGASNTGPVTFNLNGLGAKSVLKFRDQALESGDIRAGQIVNIAYDGTAFQMQSERGTYLAPGPTLALKQDKTVFPNTIDIDTNLVCLRTGACSPTGAFNLSGASKTAPFRIGAADPSTCDAAVREFFYNTATNTVKVCNATNTWSALTAGGGGGSASQIQLLHQTLNVDMAGNGAPQTFATYTIPAGTLQAGDVLRVEAVVQRTGAGWSSQPVFRVTLGNGGLPNFGLTVDSFGKYEIEWRITGNTTAVGSGMGLRPTGFAINTDDNYTPTTNFNVADTNSISFLSSLPIAAGDSFRLLYFRVLRIRL